MLETIIIEPVEESKWVSPMVVQEKKQKDEIRICIDLKKLNDACLHDPFMTPFTDEVLDNVGGHEAYSFTDGFSGYHQMNIALEDKSKTTFTTEWGCFQYTMMPFGRKNTPVIFSCVVIATFKDFIHKFLEVYIDNWIVFGLVKHHVASLCLMLDICRRHGLLVDPTKIKIIINLEAPRSVKQLREMLGNTGYYRKFIKSYAQITAQMEKLLKKDATFYWNEEFQ
eukprot:PITA_04786